MRIVITIYAIAMLTVSQVFAAPATGGVAGGDVSKMLEAILAAAQHQEKVSGDMSAMIGEFRRLVADMNSNGLLSDEKGQELSVMAETLGMTDRDNVKAAAKKLREAGSDKTGRQPKIASAATDIQDAVARLKTLLREANALRASDMLSSEIRRIIKDEEGVMNRSSQLGLDILAGGTNAQDGEKLAKEQGKIAGRVGELEGLLKEALANEVTDEGKVRFQEADEIMQRERIKGRLDVAAENITKKDLMSAVAEQQEALRALRDMLRALQPDSLDPMLRAAQDLKDILRDQTNLTAQTASDQFKTNSPALELAQADLKKRLEDAKKMLEDAKKDGKAKAGGKEKKAGEGEVKGGKNIPPVPNSKATESKMKGESPSGTGKASENNAPQKNKPKDGSSDPTDKPGDGPEKPMMEAEKAINQKQQEQAVKAQTEAANKLAEAIKNLEKSILAAKTPGMAPGMAQKIADKNKAIEDMKKKPGNAAMEAALAKALAELAQMQAPAKAPGLFEPPSQPKGLMPPRDFKKMGVYGDNPDADTSLITSLGTEERESLGRNFAQELPREYREMLKAYYEKLSK